MFWELMPYSQGIFKTIIGPDEIKVIFKSFLLYVIRDGDNNNNTIMNLYNQIN